MTSILKNPESKRILLLGMANKIFIPELKQHLNEWGLQTDSIDLLLGTYSEGNQGNYSFGREIHTKNVILKNVLLIKNIMAVKRLLRKKKYCYDVCNIHFLDVKYFFLKKWIRSLANSLIISTYGSDFYKYRKYRFLQQPLYNAAKAITFTNIKTLEEFNHFYKGKFTQKLRICSFGLTNLPAISAFITIKDFREEAKRHFGFPTDKLIVTLGYHSNPVHQHEAMIDAICSLPPGLKNQLFLVLPMAYGGFSRHIETIERKLAASEFPFYILKKFLPAEDITRFRAASDIMINVPLSDQFSATMQEYLIAKNVVITGAWLPYQTLDELGIVYSRIPQVKDLKTELINILEDFSSHKDRLNMNPLKIAQLSSWETNIPKWIASYSL